MPDEVRVWTRDELDLENAMVVAGVPTLGLVGTIVSHYLHDTLEMEVVGGVRSPYFPPIGKIHGGRPKRPFALYAMETSCGPDGACDHLVVAESDFLPFPPVQDPLARELVGWAADQGARWIVTPDGLHVPETDDVSVHGVASSETGLDRLRKMGVEVIDEGVLGGFSSLLLFEGEEQEIDTMCLLADSTPDHPDARAASRLVQVLDALVPEVDIETDPLQEEAQRIEEAVRENRARLEEQTKEMRGPGPESMMFG